MKRLLSAALVLLGVVYGMVLGGPPHSTSEPRLVVRTWAVPLPDGFTVHGRLQPVSLAGDELQLYCVFRFNQSTDYPVVTRPDGSELRYLVRTVTPTNPDAALRTRFEVTTALLEQDAQLAAGRHVLRAYWAVYDITQTRWLQADNAWDDGIRLVVTRNSDGGIALGPFAVTLSGRPGNKGVNAVAFSPDSALLASGSDENSVRLWNAATGEPVFEFKRHERSVQSLAFSPSGKLLASASLDGTVKLWDVEEREERISLREKEPASGVAFSPDGKTLASAGGFDRVIQLWDVSTGKRRSTLRGHTGSVSCVAFSPDGSTLASGGTDLERLKSPEIDVTVNVVRLWDVATGQERAVLKHQERVRAIAFSADSQTLATGTASQAGIEGAPERASVDCLKLWDVATGQERASLKGHLGDIRGLSFAPDGKTLASGSGDGTVKLWNLASGRPRLTIQEDPRWVISISSVAFSPDGQTLAAGSDAEGTVKLWRRLPEAR